MKNRRLSKYRKSSCLSKLYYWKNYKGTRSYLKLESDKTNKDGYLERCRINYYNIIDNVKKDKEKGFDIIKLTKDTLVLTEPSWEKGEEIHYYIPEKD